jgi:hypothetical protein
VQVAAGELRHAILDHQRPAPMSKFNIKVARIEAVAGAEEDAQVRITFQADSYKHLRAHDTPEHHVSRLLL